jgi:hypothetical protein
MITLPVSAMLKWLSCCLFTFVQALPIGPGGACGVRNNAFQAGEYIGFTVYYSVAGNYLAAGEASFQTSCETLDHQTVYHITARGQTLPFFDHFFKVRDRYETYLDTLTLQPRKFVRSISEGDYKKFEQVKFNNMSGVAVTNEGAFKVPDCVQDIISAMYYARNVDYSQFKTDDKIPFVLFLGNELYAMHIRLAGKEKVTTRYGTFNAIKLKPLLLKGAEFKGGETMTVWVSDDANHIPLRVESAISVGSIKADMMSFQNLRYPFSALISR